jgi:tRNA threonylcarbamoyladenosine biosynthesis protein TsaE
MSANTLPALGGRQTVCSVAEMHALAAQLARGITSSTVVLLVGELGSGKTTFVQGLAQALGVEEPVTSPSFVVVSEYATRDSRIHRLIHVDLYRLSAGSQDPAVASVLEQAWAPGVLIAIEWADRLDNPVSGELWRLAFTHGDKDDERVVTILRS